MDDIIGWWGGSVHDVTKETERSPKENGKMLGVSGGCSTILATARPLSGPRSVILWLHRIIISTVLLLV